jgi:hypothetical protein
MKLNAKYFSRIGAALLLFILIVLFPFIKEADIPLLIKITL